MKKRKNQAERDLERFEEASKRPPRDPWAGDLLFDPASDSSTWVDKPERVLEFWRGHLESRDSAESKSGIGEATQCTIKFDGSSYLDCLVGRAMLPLTLRYFEVAVRRVLLLEKENEELKKKLG